MQPHFLNSIFRKIPAAHRKYLAQRFRRLTRPAWWASVCGTAVSDDFGYDRGTPVDRYYIERFLQQHCSDIHGRVLEVKDSHYTDRFGLAVDRRDVLDIDSANRQATIVADLTVADSIPSNIFDCFILCQTLMLIYEVRSAIAHAYRILRPGGVLLVTVPAVSSLCSRRADYWRFTVASCSALFGEVFGADNITVRSHGNVVAAVGFLKGLAYDEIALKKLDEHDEDIPLIITVRAVKRQDSAP